MMRKSYFILCLVVFLFTLYPLKGVWAQAEYPGVYHVYMRLGKEALDQGKYEFALKYFKLAQVVSPASREPATYYNLTIRLQVGDVEGDELYEPSEIFYDDTEEEVLDVETDREVLPDRSDVIDRALDSYEKSLKDKTFVSPETISIDKKPKTTLGKKLIRAREAAIPEAPEIAYLNDALWATQPKTLIRLDLKTSVIFEGRNIERFLIITPGFVDIERIDRDRLNVVARKRGSTFIHVWDDRGRWTFNTVVVLPLRRDAIYVRDVELEEYAQPFSISYSNDWNAFYRGSSFDKVERENLNFFQSVEAFGETPYGDVSGFALFTKFDLSTEVTGWGAGLEDGRIGNFKDFDIQGGDITHTFSPLTISGQYIRGGLLKAEAFNNNVEYTYLRGRDRSTFGFLAPGTITKKESFLEGAKLTLFPHKENKYSFNFVRGFGDEREEFLEDRVTSFEAQNKFLNTLFSGEIGYDDNDVAWNYGGVLTGKNYNLNVNFRNIDDDYAMVTTLPANRGEIGSIVNLNANWEDVFLNSSVDIYRDRFLSNPEDPDAINLDLASTVDVNLTQRDKVKISVFYTDTPGELSPRNNFRINSNYNKRFQLAGNRTFSTLIGGTYQRARFDLSPASEYDRYSVSAGFSVPLIKGSNYFANYEYSFVDEKLSGDSLRPYVVNTGVNYSKKITDQWRGNMSVDYRNEQNTEGQNSFLAGEDSVTASMGASFRPSDDFEFFVDGRARNVWAQEPGRASFNEVDVRAGIRMSWDSPFIWNPTGYIEGYVFKDINGNKKQDEKEGGIPDVIVKVGKKETKTNEKGYFQTVVKAKKVQVSVGTESIPKGFIFSTPVAQMVEIIPHKTQQVNFGLTTHSGIFGIIYVDVNQSGKPDNGDEFIQGAKITLDNIESVISDYEGTYFFKNITPQKHTISIDVNSLPIEFIPLIKIKDAVTVTEGTTYIYHFPMKKIDDKEK